MIWCCEGCGETWELEPGAEPSRDRMGRVACMSCSRGLPFAPVIERAGRVENDETLAAMLGVSKRFIVRHRGGAISLKYADRFADKLGVHPSLLWPDEYPLIAREDID